MKRSIHFAVLFTLVIMLNETLAYGRENNLNFSLGEEFKIMKGETAHIRDTNATIYVKGFFEMPCAIPGFNCGAAYRPPHVIYELRLNGQLVDDRYIEIKKRNMDDIYIVKVIKSDYKSYANIKITRMYDACVEEKFKFCWNGLANRTLNLDLCELNNDDNRIKRCKQHISSYLRKGQGQPSN